jgi:SRSO17 transposase
MDLARVAGSRWAVGECFQQAKNTAGLDEYQVRDRRAWYAHITLSMAAHAWPDPRGHQPGDRDDAGLPARRSR